MEQILEKAFKKASSLPEDERDAFAAFILEELKQEKKWDELYQKSTESIKALANEALSEYRKGQTDKLNPDSL